MNMSKWHRKSHSESQGWQNTKCANVCDDTRQFREASSPSSQQGLIQRRGRSAEGLRPSDQSVISPWVVHPQVPLDVPTFWNTLPHEGFHAWKLDVGTERLSFSSGWLVLWQLLEYILRFPCLIKMSRKWAYVWTHIFQSPFFFHPTLPQLKWKMTVNAATL